MRWRTGVEGPCYLVSPRHIVLPAYSQEAAGGNVLARSGWANYRCHVIAGDEVLDFGEVSELKAKKGTFLI
jgi:metallophosphoesterase superfamily enzyme